MISLQDISLRRGTQLLLNHADLTIYAGQKVGIIGKNGSGKTSLFKLLMGELSLDTGELDMPRDLRKAQMLQETAGSSRSAVDYVIDGDSRYRTLENKLAAAEAAGDDNRIAALHGELELVGAWSIRNRAEQLLSGLGFEVGDFGRTVNEFSGGWRIRLNLAQALMTPSDLLLLDEPTNHLDLEATLWLQQWLLRYPGTLLLVSHDRSFLDVVVGHIVSFENGKLILTTGNYSAYEKNKAERLAQQQAAFEKQQARKKDIENFVRRFRAKASKARQAQSRIKELERMADIAPAHVDSPFTFRFREPDKLPPSLLACEAISFGYERPLVSDFSLNIRSDSRIGLLGANGQGKSTLLKVLAGKLPLLDGEITRNDHLRIGYSAQHQVDALDAAATPMQLIQRMDPKAREQEIRDFLGGFDFRGERVTETTGHFSGGEKSRLGLALVVWQKPNLLLMDEPTNHLDLEMCHSLEMGLQDFAGALILVSHDRHLLSNTVDQFLLVKDGKLEIFEGDLDDYEKLLLAQDKSANSKPVSKEDKLSKKEQRQQAADKRNALKPLRNKLKTLEQGIQKHQETLKGIEVALADPGIYEDDRKDALNDLLFNRAKLTATIKDLEEEWLVLSESLEGSR
jgi:ATP-binding cassette subfamily F protein 3